MITQSWITRWPITAPAGDFILPPPPDPSDIITYKEPFRITVEVEARAVVVEVEVESV